MIRFLQPLKFRCVHDLRMVRDSLDLLIRSALYSAQLISRLKILQSTLFLKHSNVSCDKYKSFDLHQRNCFSCAWKVRFEFATLNYCWKQDLVVDNKLNLADRGRETRQEERRQAEGIHRKSRKRSTKNENKWKAVHRWICYLIHRRNLHNSNDQSGVVPSCRLSFNLIEK